jgi:nitroreductase
MPLILQKTKICVWGGTDSNELNLLLLTHSLEKGMGIDHPRKGYGKEKAAALIHEAEVFAESDKIPWLSYAFNEALSVLDAYLAFSKQNGVQVDELEKAYMELCGHISFAKYPVGYEYYQPALDGWSEAEIERFFYGRHSIRSYKDEPVSDEVMEKVLSLAGTYPSACNRQPVKVYWTSGRESVSRIDGCIPGNKGFEKSIPNYAIIAVNRELFNAGETIQWYINGGIYTSFFILALRTYGIGRCVFQLPLRWEKLPEIRKVASIPDSYATVCAVGFGYPKENIKRLCATRKPITETSSKF